MRKVIVQQEATLDLALLKIVHELLVFFSAERRCDQRLSLATSKQCRTMRAWQPPNFTGNRSNLGETSTVGPAAMIEDVVAENLFLEMVERLLGHQSLFRLILGIALDNFFLQ